MIIISQNQNTIIETTGVTLYAGISFYENGKRDCIKADTANYSYTMALYDSEPEVIRHLRAFVEAYENGEKVFRFEE